MSMLSNNNSQPMPIFKGSKVSKKPNKTEPKNRTLPASNKKIITKKSQLKEVHFKILLLKSKFTPDVKIAEIVNKSKSTVSEHISKLIRKGYLTIDKQLTSKGKRACSVFLRGYEKQNRRVIKIRAHDLAFRAPIVRLGSVNDRIKSQGNWVETNLKNWTKFIRHFSDGVKVHVTPKSVLFYLPELIGSQPETVFNEALSIVLNYSKFLESEFPGLRLGKPDVIAEVQSNHLAIEMDVFARLCAEHGITFNGERLTVDHSKGVPELEATHKDFARDDLRTIFDFYQELVEGSTSWYDVDKELKGEGVILKTLKELSKRINFIKERQDAILNALGLDRVVNLNEGGLFS